MTLRGTSKDCDPSLLPSVPEASPEALIARPLSFMSISLSWAPPPLMFRNGIIIEYLVEYTSDPFLPVGEWTMVRSTDTMETLTGLVCFTEYNISVSARTAVPNFGPQAFTVDLVRTLNYSKCHVQEMYESTYNLCN